MWQMWQAQSQGSGSQGGSSGERVKSAKVWRFEPVGENRRGVRGAGGV